MQSGDTPAVVLLLQLSFISETRRLLLLYDGCKEWSAWTTWLSKPMS
jgi:hypothetical protein